MVVSNSCYFNRYLGEMIQSDEHIASNPTIDSRMADRKYSQMFADKWLLHSNMTGVETCWNHQLLMIC